MLQYEGFNSIEEVIEDLKQGKLIVLVDDKNRENEGDLVGAAQFAEPEMVNFMIKEGRGLVCAPMSDEWADRLNLSPMTQEITEKYGTAFTVSVDAAEGTTTGISAYDRSITLKKLADPQSKPNDFVKPGHIFPLRARKGGVLRRAGHTEGAVDLMKLAGLNPVAVICEIIKEDGTMARLPDLMKFVKKHNLKITSIAQLIEYRRKTEKLVHRIAEADLPTIYGNFRIIIYKDDVEGKEHAAVIKGDVSGKENVLVRVHSECLTGDTLGSLLCDCGQQLRKALQMIEQEGLGVVLYMRQEGRGIGLGNKIKAYHLQQNLGLDTVEANEHLGFQADLRDYGIGAQILVDLGLSTIRLMTNNPKKIVALEGYGLKVVERVPIQIEPNPLNERYLKTKKEKLGHLIDL